MSRHGNRSVERSRRPRPGPRPIASQVEDEVLHLHRGALRIAIVMILDAPWGVKIGRLEECHGAGRSNSLKRIEAGLREIANRGRPPPHGDGAAAGSRARAPSLAQACRGGGRDGHPLAAAQGTPAGQVSRPVPACPVHAIAVTKARAPSLRKRATETVAPAAKAGAPHPSCKDPSWARAWRSVDGDRMPASGVCPGGPFSWPLPARSCSRDRHHATRALLL